MNIEEIRKIVTGSYVGSAWADKVRGMSDEQVFAVYSSLKTRNHPPVLKHASAPETQQYLFSCNACRAKFATTNSETETCNHCGKPIKNEYIRIPLRKEKRHED